MYRLTRRAFNTAWHYRFPAVVLTDGYLLKIRQDVALDFVGENEEPVALVSEKTQKNIQNIYTFEEELYKDPKVMRIIRERHNKKKDAHPLISDIRRVGILDKDGGCKIHAQAVVYFPPSS